MYFQISKPSYLGANYSTMPPNSCIQGNSQIQNNFNMQNQGTKQNNGFNKQKIEEMTRDLVAQPIKDTKKKRNIPPPAKRRAISPVLAKMRKELAGTKNDSSQIISTYNAGNLTSRNLPSASNFDLFSTNQTFSPMNKTNENNSSGNYFHSNSIYNSQFRLGSPQYKNIHQFNTLGHNQLLNQSPTNSNNSFNFNSSLISTGNSQILNSFASPTFRTNENQIYDNFKLGSNSPVNILSSSDSPKNSSSAVIQNPTSIPSNIYPAIAQNNFIPFFSINSLGSTSFNNNQNFQKNQGLNNYSNFRIYNPSTQNYIPLYNISQPRFLSNIPILSTNIQSNNSIRYSMQNSY